MSIDLKTLALACMVVVLMSAFTVAAVSGESDAVTEITIDNAGGSDGDEEYGDPVQTLGYAIEKAGKGGTIVITGSPVPLPEALGDTENFKADSITFQRAEGYIGPLFISNGGDSSSIVFKNCTIDNGGSTDPVFQMDCNTVELDDTSIVDSEGPAFVVSGTVVIEVGGDVNIAGGVQIGEMKQTLFLVNDDLDGDTIELMVDHEAKSSLNTIVEYDDGDYEDDDFSSDDIELLELDDSIVKKADAEYVYLDGVNGDDDNTGYSEDQGVQTIQRAMELTQGWLDIVVLSSTYVNGDVTLEDVTIYRGEGCVNNVLIANDTLTLRNVIIDGRNLTTQNDSTVTTRPDGGYLVMAYGGGTVNIEDGTVLKNNTDIAVYGMQMDSIINMNGGTIEAGDEFGIYAYRGSEVNLYGGTIKSDYYAVGSYGSDLLIDGAVIEAENGVWAKSFTSVGFDFPATVTMESGSIVADSTCVQSEGATITFNGGSVSGLGSFNLLTSDKSEDNAMLVLGSGAEITGTIHMKYDSATDGPVIQVMDGFTVEEAIDVTFNIIPKVPFAKNADLFMFATDLVMYETSQGLMVSEDIPEVEQVYLDPVNGSDDNSGLTSETPVQTLAKAKELAAGMPIIVSNTIKVSNNETLVIEDVTLLRADGFTGYLVQVLMYGEVTIRDATLDGMNLEADNSLVHTQGGTINIEDGTIIRNNGYTAVTVVNDGHLNMTGGEIYNNTSVDDGGAVYIRKAYADITGGSIHDNTTEKSGGAIAFNSGRLAVGAVEIYGNVSNGIHSGFSDEDTSVIGGGAAIYAESNKQKDAELTVSGAVIHDNRAAGPGGAICIVDCHNNNDIEATITGVELYGNTAANGDAVYIGNSNGTYGYPAVTLSGVNSLEGDIAIGLAAVTDGPVLAVAEDYSNTERVKIVFTDEVPTVSFVSCAGEPDVNDFMVDGRIVVAAEGGLALGQEFETIYLDPRNGSDDNSGTSEAQAVKTLDRAKELAGDMPVTVCGTIEVGNNKELVVEDVTLQRAEGFDGRLIQVYVGGEVTVRDAVIDGMGHETGYSLIHAGQGTVNIEDGAVLRNNGYTAVTVYNGGGVFNMTGGEIYGNVSVDDGGAVLIQNAEAVITGGSIHDNTTAKSGGAIAVRSGDITLGAVEIYGNNSKGTHSGFSDEYTSFIGGGAAVYVEGNKQGDTVVSIDGAVIRDNVAAGLGGAVTIYDGGEHDGITVTIGDIFAKGNTAGKGAFVYIGKTASSADYPEVTLSGTVDTDGEVYLEGTGASGARFAVAEGFEPFAPIGLGFETKPEYAVATGPVSASDFVAEGYALAVGSEGLIVGTSKPTTDEEGNAVIEETFTDKDASGNTVTTTVTKVPGTGEVTEMTTSVDGVEVTTEVVGDVAVTEIAESDNVDKMIGIAVSQMPAFVDSGKEVRITAVDGDVAISADSVKALGDAGASLTVADDSIEVSVGSDVLGAGQSLTFSLTDTPTDLTNAQKAVVDDALEVIDVSAGDIHDLNGTATISVGFTLPDGYDAETVEVMYVAEDGTTETMDAVYSDGVVTFTTTHFSVYMIVADSVSEPVGPDTPDTPDTPGSSDDPGTPSVPGGWDDDDVLPPIVVEEETSDGGMTSTEVAIAVVLGVLTAAAVVALVFAARRS